MLAMGTLGLMARALVDHRQDARAVAQICTTLASLVVDGEAAAWHRAHPRLTLVFFFFFFLFFHFLPFPFPGGKIRKLCLRAD
jgi:hypothetical protein